MPHQPVLNTSVHFHCHCHYRHYFQHDRLKKFTFDATVRRKEREQLNEQISMDTVEKEKKREDERRKEMDAEMEIKRTRELEARERLQRLEMQAQFHQHLYFIVFWQYNNLSTFADICHTSPF
jgi:ribosomal protein RSM22 (predicted rRNA methylase)